MKKICLLPFIMTLMANIAFAADEIHYTITGKNSVTFDWRGAATEKSIGYGLSPGAYTQITANSPSPAPSSSLGPFWEAKLTGLKENSLYYYSIGNGPERTFRTAPVSGSSDFTVYAQGDIGDTSAFFNMGVVQDLIANGRPAFVVGLGDLSLGGANGKAAVDQHFNDVMTWSKEAAYMPVWGDQEWPTTSSDNFQNYKGRFHLPNPQTSPGTPLAGGEDWYWFDYGNTRFITLPEPWSGAWSDWNTKADVLMAQAQADTNIQYIVTFVHQPAYSSGHYTGSANLKAILDALGDRHNKYVLNLNSHSRNYERSHPQHGVVHVTAGIGGSNFQQDGSCLWLTCAQPSWSAFRAMHHGALKLHFTASAIEGSFICGPAGGGINDVNCIKGSVVDSFSIASGSSPTVASASKVAASTATTCAQTAVNVSSATLEGGYSYIIRKSFGVPADNSTYPNKSILRLFENGLEMGPAHTGHADIGNLGQGRFSHWSGTDGSGESVRFSASNNTDPRTNGKSYTYCATGTSTPALLALPAPPATTTGGDWVIQGYAAAAGVTGGTGGKNIVVTNLNESGSGSLKAAIATSGPRNITFTPGLTGTIRWTNVAYIDSDNITIDGRGANITISGYSLSVFKGNGTPARNVIIRNLTFVNTEPGRNAIFIEYGSYNVWVDHCTFRSNNLDGGVGQGIAIWDRGLGLGGLTGITISWNKFEAPNKKAVLISAADDFTKLTTKVSLHHNWFDNITARSPRLAPVTVHMWNNYISNWTEYGTAINGAGDLLLQNNIYEKSIGGTAVDANYGNIPSNSTNATGNLVLGNPLPVIETRGTFPSAVINYTAPLETANNTLKQRLIQGAGAH